MNIRLEKRQRPKRKMPLNTKRKLIETPKKSSPRPKVFRNKIEENKALFIQYMKEKYRIPKVKFKEWSGSPLHFLELSSMITPEMHQAAHNYFYFSKKVLQDGPKKTRSSLKPKLEGKPIIPIDEKAEKEWENHWQSISSILNETKTKQILNDLEEDSGLKIVENLMKTDEALERLQRSLTKIHGYLQTVHL